MSHASLIGRAPAAVVPRRFTAVDLPRVAVLAAEAALPPWLDDLPSVLKARGTAAWLAEGEGQVVGLLVCRCDGAAAAATRRGLFRELVGRLCGLGSGRKAERLEAHLLDLRVATEWSGARVERALLGRLDEDLRRSAGRVEVVVPESSLSVQLFLRDAGYRATEILHGHYGTEDGYRMTWQPYRLGGISAPGLPL